MFGEEVRNRSDTLEKVLSVRYILRFDKESTKEKGILQVSILMINMEVALLKTLLENEIQREQRARAEICPS